MSQGSTTQTLGYAEFGDWYDAYRSTVLEPALETASAALDAALTELLSERDLARICNVTGRVKSKRRAWRKLRQPRYLERIGSTADIPVVIDDLVGLRVTCTNLRDIDMVQAALDSLPRKRGRGQRLWLDPASERDYVIAPKESGYRGWHVNLGIVVRADGRRVPVTCELQVRTLLQDSWGELTHEDTYSKDGALPPLVEVLSKRMADLFSTLDDIAEDLRTELDRIDEAVVAGPEEADDSPDDADTFAEQDADASAVLLERWRNLDRPTELASLAWGLQREFGAEISDGWFGHGSFKRFLRHAVPEGEISTGRQAYLLPPAGVGVGEQDEATADHDEEPPSAAQVGAASGAGTATDADDSGDARSSIPGPARQLRRSDREFPMLEADQWPHLYSLLADAWQELGTRKPTTRFVNQLTRTARDMGQATGTPVSRRHFDYVAKTVLSPEGGGEPLDADQIAAAFTALTTQRMADLRILGPKNRQGRAAVERWLRGG